MEEQVIEGVRQVVNLALIRYEAGEEELEGGSHEVHLALVNESRAMLEGMIGFALSFADPLRSQIRELVDAGMKEIREREARREHFERTELTRYLVIAAGELRQ